MGIIDNIRGVFAIIALLFAVSTAFSIMRGDLEEGLTPGWIDFATTHPMVFAFVLVVGSAVFGTPFITAVDNF